MPKINNFLNIFLSIFMLKLYEIPIRINIEYNTTKSK